MTFGQFVSTVFAVAFGIITAGFIAVALLVMVGLAIS